MATDAERALYLAAEIIASREGKARGGINLKTAAEAANLDQHMVSDAVRVLYDGTDREIAQVRAGERTLATLAKLMRAGKTREERTAHFAVPVHARGRKVEQHERQRMQGGIYGELRQALKLIAGLPAAADVVACIKAHHRANTGPLPLLEAIAKLEEVADVYTA